MTCQTFENYTPRVTRRDAQARRQAAAAPGAAVHGDIDAPALFARVETALAEAEAAAQLLAGLDLYALHRQVETLRRAGVHARPGTDDPMSRAARLFLSGATFAAAAARLRRNPAP